MKKISIMLCALFVSLLTACTDTCGFMHGDPNTTYTWSYTNNGVTSAGEFTTNEYGQATFDVPEDTNCNNLKIDKKADDGEFQSVVNAN